MQWKLGGEIRKWKLHNLVQSSQTDRLWGCQIRNGMLLFFSPFILVFLANMTVLYVFHGWETG